MTMTSLAIGLVVLAVLFGGALLGMLLARRLPAHHLSAETKAVVTTCMAVVGTMAALVIGLLISNGSTAFKARTGDLAVLASDIVRLDIVLQRYGPAALPARDVLQRYAIMKFNDLFPADAARAPDVDNPATRETLETVQDRLLAMTPADQRQRWLHAAALQLTADVGEAKTRLSLENVGSVPLPFLGAVVLWLIVLFASFGLFAPRNVTAVVALFMCAFSIAAAIKLVLDMDTPFGGRILLTPPPIHVSGEPMRQAIEAIRH